MSIIIQAIKIKRKADFRSFVIFFLLIFLLAFTSCKNIFEDSVSDNHDDTKTVESSNPEEKNTPSLPVIQTQKPRRVSYSGSVSVSVALPSEIRKIVNAAEGSASDNKDRSATAALPSSSDYEYYVRAVAATDTQEVIPTLTNSGRVFELQLLVDVEYTLSAGYRKKASGTPGQSGYVPAKDMLKDVASVSGEPYLITITEEELSPAPYNFVLVPLQTSSGKGAINLAIAEIADSNINSLKLFVAGEDGKPVAWQTDALDIDIQGSTSDGKYIRSKKDSNGNILYNIPSGCYEISMNFYKTDSSVNPAITYIAYQTIQTINIYDNLITDVWQNETSSSSSSVIDSSTGEFKLTSNLVNNFLQNLLYVGVPENLAGNSSVLPASDSNTGRAYSPLKTLGRALSLIKQDGNGADYRIYITGDMKDSYAGDYFLDDSFNTKATSIEIKGIGSSRSVLQGSGTGSVFTITTSSSVTFENVQITGGNTDQGAGIYADSGATVILGSGTLVGKEGSGAVNAENCGNLGETEGAGIYVAYGTLILKNGSRVCRNYINNGGTGGDGGGIFCDNASLTIEAGAEISGNKAEGRAGGVYMNTGSLTMKGGSISSNTAGTYGGGVYLGIGSMIMKNSAVITKNTAAGANAGGIYVESGCSLTLLGGTVSNNKSSVKGGGVTVKKGGSFKLSGSAAIPYGVTENSTTTRAAGKNDIYLERTTEGCAVIELAGAVASDFSEVGITTGGADSVSDGDWVLGQQVVNAAAGTSITESFAEKINCLFPDEEWDKVLSTSAISASCPFFVGSYTNQNGDLIIGSDDNSGTKASPFKTINKACQQMNDKDIDYVIKIIGTTAVIENGQYKLSEMSSQYVPNSLSTAAAASHKAKSVLITGARGLDEYGMPQDSIDRGLEDTTNNYASALGIQTSVPVTITNLLITGARANTTQSGIYVDANAKVTLGDGVVITGNACYALTVFNGGKAAICGTCIIGNPNVSEKPQDEYTDSTHTNRHGINCEGELYLGARMNADGTHTEEAWTGAIMGNNGCGLYIDGFANDSNPKDDPVKCIMYSGSIKYNFDSENGGGIHVSGSGANAQMIIKGGEIQNNNIISSKSGSGIYIDRYNTLTFDGPISIVNNDVYLDYKTINVTENFRLKETDKKIPVKKNAGDTLRNTNVLTGSVNDTNVGYIDFPATGFKLAHIEESNNHYGRMVFKHILKNLYVASTGDDSSRTGPAGVDPSGYPIKDSYWQQYQYASNSLYSFNEETSGSNAAHPFATIKKALQFITYQQTLKDENGTAFDYTIYIDGKVLGTHKIESSSDDYITLKASGQDATANKIILKSKNTGTTDTAPRDILDANGSTSDPCLTIKTTVPIEITDLGITGANTVDSGGGIRINAQNANPSSDVTINGKTQIYGNTARYGGGISCSGYNSTKRASLKIGGDTRIFNNTGSYQGGGIYITFGDVCLYGNAVVGEAGKTTYATATEGQNRNHSNTAVQKGGGIYALKAGVYLGYTAPNVADTNDYTGGVMYNYVSSTADGQGLGGGIYSDGVSGNTAVLKIAKGKVSNNGTDIADTNYYSKGGGIYLGSEYVTFEMSGGTIAKNRSCQGGGIYSETSDFRITGGTIGDLTNSLATSTDCSNYAQVAGGGIVLDCWTDEDTFINGGTISRNYSYSNGGGLYIIYVPSMTIEDTSSENDTIIKNNFAGEKGGGIYFSGPLLSLNAEMNNNQVDSDGVGGGIFIDDHPHQLILNSDFNITTNNYSPAKGKDDIAMDFWPDPDGDQDQTNSIICSDQLLNFDENKKIGLVINNDSEVWQKIIETGNALPIIAGEQNKFILLNNNEKIELQPENGDADAYLVMKYDQISYDDDITPDILASYYECDFLGDTEDPIVNDISELTNKCVVVVWDRGDNQYCGAIEFRSFTTSNYVDINVKIYNYVSKTLVKSFNYTGYCTSNPIYLDLLNGTSSNNDLNDHQLEFNTYSEVLIHGNGLSDEYPVKYYVVGDD